MKKILFMLATLSMLINTHAQACTDEEFKALDKEITEIQKKHFAEKSAQLENYLQQIKTKKNLDDKALFIYRTNILRNPEAQKIYDKERKLTFGDLFRLTAEKDCKSLQKWTDESLVSANKQWDIVFEALEKELK